MFRWWIQISSSLGKVHPWQEEFAVCPPWWSGEERQAGLAQIAIGQECSSVEVAGHGSWRCGCSCCPPSSPPTRWPPAPCGWGSAPRWCSRCPAALSSSALGCTCNGAVGCEVHRCEASLRLLSLNWCGVVKWWGWLLERVKCGHLCRTKAGLEGSDPLPRNQRVTHLCLWGIKGHQGMWPDHHCSCTSIRLVRWCSLLPNVIQFFQCCSSTGLWDQDTLQAGTFWGCS